jgi:hypothetical protein
MFAGGALGTITGGTLEAHGVMSAPKIRSFVASKGTIRAMGSIASEVFISRSGTEQR